jgi:arylsulfatase A-like enzyme
MAGNTLVAFLSDNGGASPGVVRPWVSYLIREFRTWGSDNAPLRGGKTDVFDGGLRVPAILRWPGVLEGGRTLRERVTALDLLPTLVEALDLGPEDTKPLHGESRWDVIARGATTPPKDFVAGNMASYAYFRGPWKLVMATSPLPFFKPSGTFLFRIEEDPFERNDLAAEHPEVVRELQQALASFPKTESTFVPPMPWEVDQLFGGEETGPPIAESGLRD